MGFPVKSLEWRRVGGAQAAWHFFLKQQSVCGRVTSNGSFDFAEDKPPKNAKVCKFCVKEIKVIKERTQKVL